MTALFLFLDWLGRGNAVQRARRCVDGPHVALIMAAQFLVSLRGHHGVVNRLFALGSDGGELERPGQQRAGLGAFDIAQAFQLHGDIGRESGELEQRCSNAFGSLHGAEAWRRQLVERGEGYFEHAHTIAWRREVRWS